MDYRVISADSHPVSGAFTYSVGAPSTPPTDSGAESRANLVLYNRWFQLVASLIALRFGESQRLGLSALMAAGLALFALTLIVNMAASAVVSRSRSGKGCPPQEMPTRAPSSSFSR